MASIPQGCNGWAETQAAHRFLMHGRIGWEGILAPHFGCTQQRILGWLNRHRLARRCDGIRIFLGCYPASQQVGI
jgi:hypothetical protein